MARRTSFNGWRFACVVSGNRFLLKKNCYGVRNPDSHNTKFFRLTTIVRRHHNLILALKMNDVWVRNEEVLCQHILEFYSSLFPRKPCQRLLAVFDSFVLKVSEEEKIALTAPLQLIEVRLATFSMKGLKAPSIDGVQPIFYQKQWDIVKDIVFQFVHMALMTLFPVFTIERLDQLSRNFLWGGDVDSFQ
ncbi:hypothetical protein K2173_021242 [Erythroxylum novogranatense]|uniref:Uncharacterized protein n=1 Tax=Erythroxylum novogranatense TaxID=1862640 RepID=A0AAV8TN61_9ROSI|nr:hypothetical protein K2173_021242 [Erythroxylum novogranatense]